MKAGRFLVILNEMVLDLGDYLKHHPGGRFVLVANRGCDISKFFYGGYSLEDNDQSVKGHNHSNYAKLICNSLVVAVY